MADNNAEKISLFKDLLKRRVPQIIGVYLAGCWAFIQFIIWIVDEFALSPYLPQLSFILLVSMLPTVILLAYFHGKPGKDKWTMTEKIAIPSNILFAIIIVIIFFHGKDLGAQE